MAPLLKCWESQKMITLYVWQATSPCNAFSVNALCSTMESYFWPFIHAAPTLTLIFLLFFPFPFPALFITPPPILLSKFQIPFLFCTEQVSVSLLLSRLHIHTSQGPKAGQKGPLYVRVYPSRKAVVVKRAFLVLLQHNVSIYRGLTMCLALRWVLSSSYPIFCDLHNIITISTSNEVRVFRKIG